MIKIGKRHNLIYPSLFVASLGLRRIIKYILEIKKWISFEGPFLLSLVMYIFEFAIGGIISYKIYLDESKINLENQESNERRKIPKRYLLIREKKDYIPPDSFKKIIFLLILAAIAEFIGEITRRYIIEGLVDYESEQINIRLRSLEIIISSFLCFFILTKEFKEVKKHHFITLNIIGICLICSLILEFIFFDEYNDIWKGLLFLLISSLTRAFLDIIEKYLLDTDGINAFKMTAFESFVDIIISLFCYIFEPPREEIYHLFAKNGILIFFAIILLLIYGVLSFLKNIYRRFSLMNYSPMTRALAESILDPLIVFYEFFNYAYDIDTQKEEHEKNYKHPKIIHLILIFILTIIMVFCSCVFNEFLIIDCCNYDTYDEINKRAFNDISDKESSDYESVIQT